MHLFISYKEEETCMAMYINDFICLMIYFYMKWMNEKQFH